MFAIHASLNVRGPPRKDDSGTAVVLGVFFFGLLFILGICYSIYRRSDVSMPSTRNASAANPAQPLPTAPLSTNPALRFRGELVAWRFCSLEGLRRVELKSWFTRRWPYRSNAEHGSSTGLELNHETTSAVDIESCTDQGSLRFPPQAWILERTSDVFHETFAVGAPSRGSR